MEDSDYIPSTSIPNGESNFATIHRLECGGQQRRLGVAVQPHRRRWVERHPQCGYPNWLGSTTYYS